ncbi:MAG: acetoin utilization protein AcuC, partial [Rhodospirillaceae bacterium]|nr:acetoin utilization protein AcuC [Rhodospirillaceae bacterium]
MRPRPRHPGEESMRQARLIASEIYRRSSYGGRHPLAIPRVSAALDLIRAMGWLDESRYIDSPVATPAELARFHDPAYIAAVRRAERTGRVGREDRQRFNIGINGNPVFPEIFSRPATACGGSLLAAKLLLEGEGIVFNLAGGTHHGRPDRASGFCYFNDPVLAMLRLLDGGVQRVCYVDLDAHHCDGVQDAFAGDPRVLVISIHEEGRWPRTGAVDDRAGGSARNLPVPSGLNDSELGWLIGHAVVPLVRGFGPEVVILQCGADALADDPMSRLELSNRALWAAVAALRDLAPRLLALGGGGYNPWAVARCWAGVWAVLAGIDPDAPPTAAARAVLGGLTWSRSQGCDPPARWLTTIADPPRPGPVRAAVM